MQLFTRTQAAQLLGISKSTLDYLRIQRKIGYIQQKPGSKVYFRTSDIELYLAKATKPAER